MLFITGFILFCCTILPLLTQVVVLLMADVLIYYMVIQIRELINILVVWCLLYTSPAESHSDYVSSFVSILVLFLVLYIINICCYLSSICCVFHFRGILERFVYIRYFIPCQNIYIYLLFESYYIMFLGKKQDNMTTADVLFSCTQQDLYSKIF